MQSNAFNRHRKLPLDQFNGKYFLYKNTLVARPTIVENVSNEDG